MGKKIRDVRSRLGHVGGASLSFNPLRIPDTSEKLLREGYRTLQGMQNVHESEMRNRSEQLSAMKENDAKVEAQREDNRRLDVQFAAAYKEAELQPLKVAIQDTKNRKEFLKAKGKEDAALAEQFKELIPQAFTMLKGHQEKKLQQAAATALDVVTEHGLTVQSLSAKEQIEDQMLAIKAGTSTLLAKNGGSFTEQQAYAISRLDGMELYAAHQLLAKRYGTEGWQHYYNTIGINKVLASGHTIAELQGITTRDVSKELQAGYAEIRADFIGGDGLKRNDGTPIFTEDFIAGEIKPWINKHKAKFDITAREQQAQFYGWKKKDTDSKLLEHMLTKGGGEDPSGNWDKLVYALSGETGNKGRVTRQLQTHLVHLYNNGKIDRSTIEAIGEGNTTIEGKNGEQQNVRRDVQWKSSWDRVYEQMDFRDTKALEQYETKQKRLAGQVFAKVNDYNVQFGGLWPADAVGNLNAWVVNQGGDPDHPAFDQVFKVLDNDLSIPEDNSWRLAETNLNSGNLTRYELVNNTDSYSTNTVRKILDDDKLRIKLVDGDDKEALKELRSQAERLVRERVTEIGGGVTSYTARLSTAQMEHMSKQLAERYFFSSEFASSEDGGTLIAPQARISKVIEKIKKEVDAENGMFRLIKQARETMLGHEGGYDIRNWLEKQHAGAERVATLIRTESLENPEYPFQKGRFDEDSLDHIEMFALRGTSYGRGGVPVELQKLDSVYKNMGLTHIARKILVANGRELPAWSSRDLKTEALLSQQFRRLVTNKPSQAKLETAINNTLLVTGQAKEDTNKIVNAFTASPEAISTSGANAGNSLQTPTGFETSNTEYMTTDSILIGMRNGTILGAGKWNTSEWWLQLLDDNNVLNQWETFNEEAQEKAATLYRWDQSSCFRTEGGTLIPGCGHPSYIAEPPPLTQEVENAFRFRGFKTDQFILGLQGITA